MLNGLGDRCAIDALRDGIARKAGVKVAYNAADMSKPAEIADLVTDGGWTAQ
jgi:3-hydroxybutyrate dehydrogenase